VKSKIKPNAEKSKIVKKNTEEVFTKKSNIIDVASGIAVKIDGKDIVLEKNGSKTYVRFNPVYAKIILENGKLTIAPTMIKKRAISVVNAVTKLVKNAIAGFDKEYVYKLSVVYSHFPMNIKVEGNMISVLNYLGEKKARKCRIMPGSSVEVKGKEIIVKGKDKYNAGQTAGNLEKMTKITKRDYRIFDDGCYIIERP